MTVLSQLLLQISGKFPIIKFRENKVCNYMIISFRIWITWNNELDPSFSELWPLKIKSIQWDSLKPKYLIIIDFRSVIRDASSAAIRTYSMHELKLSRKKKDLNNVIDLNVSTHLQWPWVQLIRQDSMQSQKEVIWIMGYLYWTLFSEKYHTHMSVWNSPTQSQKCQFTGQGWQKTLAGAYWRCNNTPCPALQRTEQ